MVLCISSNRREKGNTYLKYKSVPGKRVMDYGTQAFSNCPDNTFNSFGKLPSLEAVEIARMTPLINSFGKLPLLEVVEIVRITPLKFFRQAFP
jgi:hypothetical protein